MAGHLLLVLGSLQKLLLQFLEVLTSQIIWTGLRVRVCCWIWRFGDLAIQLLSPDFNTPFSLQNQLVDQKTHLWQIHQVLGLTL